MCTVDHTPFETRVPPLWVAEEKQNIITLMKCRTLVDADMVVSRLKPAGIEAFLPDESLMQTTGWNLNTYGYVRVQIATKDYEAAREKMLR